jgi:Peptidase family M49
VNTVKSALVRELAVAALCLLAVGCPASDKDSDRARRQGTAAAPRSADPLPARSAPAADSTRPLGSVEGVQLERLDAAAFATLSPRSKLLAYHLIQACEAGTRVSFAQHHRDNLEIKDLLETLLLDRDLSVSLRPRVERYMARFWLQRGHHDLESGRKFIPGFSVVELRSAAVAALGRGIVLGPRDEVAVDLLLGRLGPTLFDGARGALLDQGTLDFYRGLTASEVRGYAHRFPRNSRLVKHRGAVTEEVWRAGGGDVAEGLYVNELHQVVKHLNRALPLAKGEQAVALGQLVKHLITGDPAAYQGFVRRWERAAPEVEFALGFLSTQRDPLGLKGTYRAAVGVGCTALTGTARAKAVRERRCQLLYACGDPGRKARWPLHLGRKRVVWSNLRRQQEDVGPAYWVPAAYVAVSDPRGANQDVRAVHPGSWVGFNLARSRAWRLQNHRPLRLEPSADPRGRLVRPLRRSPTLLRRWKRKAIPNQAPRKTD